MNAHWTGDPVALREYAQRHGLDPMQLAQAPPSNCRYCGKAIYWEVLPSGKKRPVDALDLDSHLCLNRPRRKGTLP